VEDPAGVHLPPAQLDGAGAAAGGAALVVAGDELALPAVLDGAPMLEPLEVGVEAGAPMPDPEVLELQPLTANAATAAAPTARMRIIASVCPRDGVRGVSNADAASARL
jgi:hypothetical protein